MNQNLFDSFIKAHYVAGQCPSTALHRYLTLGYVLSTPTALMMGEEEGDDTWFVYWAEATEPIKGNKLMAIAQFLHWMPHYRPNVRWQHGVRGDFRSRIYSTTRLLRFINK